MPRSTMRSTVLFVGMVSAAALASVDAGDLDRYVIDTDGVSKKIINGIQFPYAKYMSDYRWFAQLIMDGSTGCGGSLIADRWVLTAAHCTTPVPTTLRVHLGGYDHCGKTGCFDSVERKVVRVINHPSYNTNQNPYDVSLLELESPVTTITPVGIRTQAFARQDTFSTHGRNVEVFGFGQTIADKDDDNTPTNIRLTTVQLVNQFDCNRAPYSYSSVDETMVCGAGYGSNGQPTDSCQGDSGGPLYSPTENKLVGVVSWGAGCAIADSPGVYADVGFLSSWISSNMASNSPPTPPPPPLADACLAINAADKFLCEGSFVTQAACAESPGICYWNGVTTTPVPLTAPSSMPQANSVCVTGTPAFIQNIQHCGAEVLGTSCECTQQRWVCMVSSLAPCPPQCLSQTTSNTVSMQAPYLFNGVAYDASKSIGMNVGTYTFAGITTAHPFGIYISDASVVEVTAGTYYSSGNGYNYYTGTVVVNVKANFGTASYGCALHGYMGGQNRLEFRSDCSTAPLTTTAATTIHSSGKLTCSQLGWTKVVNGVCGESDAKLGPSGSNRCTEASLADATGICSAAGARLCSVDEIDSGATTGTGCGFDLSYTWTSTWCGLGPEGGKYYVGMGGGGFPSDRKCKNPKKLYPVRCCADVDISATTPLPATTSTTFPFLSNRKNCATLGWETKGSACGESDKAFKKGLDKCFTWKNHPDAERKCLKLGARMCSQSDIEAGVGKATGCGFDSQFLWTSTSCGTNSFIKAKGNGDGSTECAIAKSKGPMRCCSDVNV